MNMPVNFPVRSQGAIRWDSGPGRDVRAQVSGGSTDSSSVDEVFCCCQRAGAPPQIGNIRYTCASRTAVIVYEVIPE